MAKDRKKPTIGTLAVALFGWVILSGIMLAVPYDVSQPYRSVGKIMLFFPYASFIRNMHYWSSQWFLILSLLHLWDHFRKKQKVISKQGLWFRLTLGVLIIFLAMLTGFLLKGDADSRQARLILSGLINEIPGVGNLLSFSLLGAGNGWQLIYVHHVATFTLFLSIIILEHSRKIWPGAMEFLLTGIASAVPSLLLTAPLHDTLNGTVKGPWYFTGLQEILHQVSHPLWVLILILAVLLLIGIIPFIKLKQSVTVRHLLLVFAAVYMVLSFTGFFFRGENWQWITPGSSNYKWSVLGNMPAGRVVFSSVRGMNDTPLIRGQYESCLLCHKQTHGFSPSHNPETTGCYACHGGNPYSAQKEQAHKGMRLIPGNLDDAQISCGTTRCHPDITRRINSGLMASLSGMISVDRYVFGEISNPDSLTSVHHLGNSAADTHLKNLCVRCHLGNPKTETGPVTEFSRGGGCLACHLNAGTNEGNIKVFKPDSVVVKHHASVSLNVGNNHCFGCHSRSGRISTNYEGWHETLLEPTDMPRSPDYRLVENSRVFEKKTPDVHHASGLDCIDCHTSYELMGDGTEYRHEEEQQDVQCTDCHFKGKPRTVSSGELDEESAVIASLRYGDITGLQFLKTARHNRPLINTRFENDTALLIGKNSKKRFVITGLPKRCSRDKSHENVTCSACHSAWAPSCIGCHNSYDPEEPSYDMIRNRPVKGGWVEYTGEFKAVPPALGIRTVNGKREVIPVIPGMILSIDKKSFTLKKHDSLIFRRLYAPAAPHTTAAEGRSCTSCHNNPVALGFGEGTLKYEISEGKGVWIFSPEYAGNNKDGLPEDAWTGFLKNRTGMVSTRRNVRPFNVREQRKMLTVGACLTCHNENDAPMKESLSGFDFVFKKRKKNCVVPEW